MRRHSFLRAYMAGVLLPTGVLLIVLAAFLTAHLVWHVPPGLERALVFPMAVVPNLWGVWNALYIQLGLRQRISLGIYGALLPALLVPAGVALAAGLDLSFYTAREALMVLPVAMGIYYLAWKYVVSFLNRVVELN